MRAYLVERFDFKTPNIASAAAEFDSQAAAERAAQSEWRVGRVNQRTVRVLDPTGAVVWLMTIGPSPKTSPR